MHKAESNFKSKVIAGLDERMKSAADAKKAQLEKWRLNMVDVNDPVYLERQAIRLTAAAAQAEREIQRKEAREAAKAQAIADRKKAQELLEAQQIADQAARETAEAEAAAELIALRDKRKAARDARYAARKARK
ncbi:MAG: DUF6481 family protein [Rhodospirillaceae bacterium]